MPKHLYTRLLSMLLVLAMVLGFAAPASTVHAAEDTHTHVSAEDTQAQLSFEEIDADGYTMDGLYEADDLETNSDQNYEDTDVVRVSIVLEKESTIDAGFSTLNIAGNAEAMAYREKLQDEQVEMTAVIEQTIGETLDVAWNLTLAANIISANVQYGQIDAIAELPGVKEVVLETRYEPAVYSSEKTADPQTATSGTMIGASAAYANGYTGAGSRIAVIDTGIDTDHQSFSAAGFNYSLAYQAGLAGKELETYLAELDLLDVEEITSVMDRLNIQVEDPSALYVSSKIPFAFNYVDEDLDVTHDNDNQGEHGSHVEGIAAANAFIPNADGTFSRAVDTVLAQGVAPDAQIITMKVFGKNGGAYDSDYMVAIEDAIVLGCDSVNLSLGTTAHGFGYNTTYQEILNNLTKSDTVVTCSGGNNGHWADYAVSGVPYLYNTDVSMFTGGAPGAYTNAMAVASVNNDGTTGNYFTVGEEIVFFNDGQSAQNASLLTLAGTAYEYVLLDSVGTAEEFAALADVLPGKIAVCSRGTTSFFEKANAAVANGAAGVIIANNTTGVIYLNLSGYSYKLPVVSITQAAGQMMKESAKAVTDEEGNVLYYLGTMTVASDLAAAPYYSDYYTMSSFSAWGVPGSLELKPEITAPGGNIYSVDGSVDGGQAYEIMSGTSMAAPQVAGMAAIVAQYIRENGLEETTGLSVRQLAQSLLMSTAVPKFEEESGGNYYSVLRQGSGLANVGSAVSAQSYILMGEDATESWADGKVKAELGDDPARTGEYSFSFSLNNMSEETKTYTLSADFFTQGLFAYAGYIFLDTWTTALPANVTFTVNGETFVPVSGVDCDLDNDGDTDADDAQIIIEYCSGSRDTIADIADVDGNGTVTTYDAYLILDSMETRNITVAAGDKAEITVTAVLPQALKNYLNTYYPNGAYVEGYVHVLPTSTEEGVFTDVTHSIPVLGFYGSWTDASMYEPITYTEYVYKDYMVPYTGYVSNNLIIKYPGDSNTYWQIGNPYFIEGAGYPAERVAISSESTLYSYPAALMRNADALMWVITDEAGQVLSMSNVSNRVYGSYYYINYGSWQNTTQNIAINKKVSALGLTEGDKFTVSVVAVPEYYQTNGALTAEQVLKLMEDGALGEGAYLSTTLTVDDTAPVISDIYKDMKTGNLIVTASDNNYVAAVKITSVSGSKTYGYGYASQTEAGQLCAAEVDLSGAAIGEECVVLVADYANNISAYKITYGGEGEDYSGKLYGFTYTSLAKSGSGSRWMEIDPDHLYSYWKGYEGLTQVATMPDDIIVTAAEYVEGYVFMAANNGKLYAAPQEELSMYKEVGDLSATTSKIWDMAFNYTDNKLYAVGNNSVVYTVDLISGELTQAFTVTLTNPATSSASAKTLWGLAIDSDGNFWGTNSGSSWSTFLYKWTKDDIVDGAVTNLAPVVNNRNSDADSQSKEGGLAWDFTTDTLYWCCAYSTSYSASNNALYRFNLETGKATKASSYYGSASSSYASCLGDYYTAFYIVPGDMSLVPPTTNASSVVLDITEMSMLKGAWFDITATVYPWNLADNSVTWASSDESVVTVDNGHVTAVGVGSATVTATTVASPNLQATCEITVTALPSTNLSALIYDAESTTHWSEFNTDDTTQWTAISGDSEYIIGGTELDGVIYGHDGSTMYAVDPDTFEVTTMGGISSLWRWSDAAPAPRTADGKSFGLTTAICNNGTYLELVNVPAGTLNYFDLSSSFSGDPMAAIAYAGSGTYTVPSTSTLTGGTWPTVNYYILTEGGNIWYLSLYSYKNNANFEICEQTWLGQVDLSLEGVSAVVGGTYASLLYDQASGYLLLSHYGEGETAILYAIDLKTMLVANIGSFGENVWPVVSLYQYTRPTDLTVRVTPSVADLYEGETASFSAKVLPTTFTGGVVWSSSDEAVATVDQNGVVTAVGEGTATITATSVDVNAEGQTVSASATVTVEGLTELDTTVYGQITTTDGTSKWVTIKTADLSTYTVNGTADIVLKGGGAHEGKIWGHNEEPYYVSPWNWWNFVTIDPETHETEDHGWTLGAEDIDDLTTAPAYNLKTSNADGEEFYVEAMGNPIYVSNGRYVEYLKKDYISDYDNDTYLFTGLKNYGMLGAITFVGLAESTGYTAEEFYVLCDNGDLIRLLVEMRPNPRDAANNYMLRYWRHSFLGNIGVDFVRSDDLSMVLINDGVNYGLLIAESGDGRGELYYEDLNTEGYAARKVGELEGVTYLTSLYTDYELNYDTGEGDAAVESVNGEGTATSSSATLLLCDSYTGEALAEEPATETAVNRVGGGTETFLGETIVKERPQADVNGGSATVADQSVSVELTETEAVTNGVMKVSYDPKVLTYSGATSPIGNTDVHVDAENGIITFAYASVNALSAGSILATLNFSYTAQYIDTEITITTTQRNEAFNLEGEPVVLELVYEVGGHDYEVTESVEATCTEPGYKVFVCTKCGDTYREDYEAKGHDYQAEVTEPTCTEQGYTTYTCTVCGDSYVDDFVDAAGHSYEAVVTAPTCTEMGYTVYTCSVCGDSYTADYVNPTGHSYEKTVTAPTCTEMGYTTYTCACGDSYKSDYVAAKGHSFGDWETVTEPGCESKGLEKRTCACGEVEYRDTDPKGHSYEAVVTEPTCTEMGYTTYTCACGHSYKSDYVNPKGHSYTATVTEPTCTEMGYTTYTCACGDSYKSDYTSPKGHSYGDWETVKAATCTAKGQEKRTCACGAVEYRDTDMVAHSYTATVTAPTCTESGYTTHTCAVCGHSYVTDVTDPTGHSFGEWTVTKAATCTEKGEEQRTCACGETETRETAKLPHSYEATVIEPTCTEVGYTIHTCACGESYKTDWTAPKGHSYVTETVEPTCTESGYVKETCDLCGDSHITEVLNPTGHTYESVVTEPTCTEQGYTTHTCHCGESYVDTYVDALGHSYGEWTVTRQETCTEDGEQTCECATCGDVKTEAIPAYCPAEAFSDLDTSKWYHEGVCYVLRNGIMNGMGDGIFAPDKAMTRAELVTTLYRVAGSPDVEDLENPFEDVSDDTWYTDAVIWAANNGVVNGTSETTFTPNALITREQLAAILYRYSGAEAAEEDYLKDFSDADAISAYAVEAMNWAVAKGLITGMGDGTLAPRGTATRAQVATILMRYCSN